MRNEEFGIQKPDTRDHDADTKRQTAIQKAEIPASGF
jgi:hypothetical protein